MRFAADHSETPDVVLAANRWHQLTSVSGLDDLKIRIMNAISAISADMLHRTWQELE
jgi:hypothetical protein